MIAGLISGIISGLIVSGFFHRLSGKQLRKEAARLKDESDRLRRLTTLTLRALEQSDFVGLTRDESGEITGLTFDEKITLAMKRDVKTDA